ncbi:MAG: hypothetical protein HQ567_18385 [Candidatus Nealsonbacteria bacterium]|nr:hypothetical protein [Candidatus Nealsonbacteria bacterium]
MAPLLGHWYNDHSDVPYTPPSFLLPILEKAQKMKHALCLLIALCLMAFGILGCDKSEPNNTPAKNTPTDPGALEGTWVVFWSALGESLYFRDMGTVSTYRNGKVTPGNGQSGAKYEVRADQVPAEIDITIQDDPAEEEFTLQGIYKIERDQLTSCVSPEKRPTVFRSTSGVQRSRQNLQILRRRAWTPGDKETPFAAEEKEAIENLAKKIEYENANDMVLHMLDDCRVVCDREGHARTIHIKGTNAADDPLAEIAKLTKTEVLMAENFDFPEQGLKKLRSLENLEMLVLWGPHHLTSQSIEDLEQLKKLRVLGLLSDSDPKGKTLETIGKLPDLEFLLTGFSFKDDDLVHLKNPKNLRVLWFCNQKMTDAGLEHLVEIKTLKHLYVDAPNVTREGIKKLKAALPDCEIHACGITYGSRGPN